MSNILNYAPSKPPVSSKVLTLLALTTLLYPIFVVMTLYGEWLLAWHVLGHPPQPSRDDPKFINGSSWLHPYTGLVLAGALPALCMSFLLWVVLLVINRRPDVRIRTPLMASVVVWGILFALLFGDPGQVINWWFD